MTDLSEIKFLVIGDLRINRHILCGLLSKIGAKYVEEAEDGTVALAMLKQGHYDLVLCESKIPDMDGLELLAAMRSEEKLKHIPVVLMTTKTCQEDIQRASKLGAARYLHKHPSKATLEEVIQAALQKQKLVSQA